MNKRKYTQPRDLKRRKEEILGLSDLDNKSDFLATRLNFLVIQKSEVILKRKGKFFDVKYGKLGRRKFKTGECYPNSANLMSEGYGYVEGYTIDKKTKFKIAHAWNIDKDGHHLDFTFKNAEDYDYFGVVIPQEIVYMIGMDHGKRWYAVLPFVSNF